MKKATVKRAEKKWRKAELTARIDKKESQLAGTRDVVKKAKLEFEISELKYERDKLRRRSRKAKKKGAWGGK